jgi:hypothetical protein
MTRHGTEPRPRPSGNGAYLYAVVRRPGRKRAPPPGEGIGDPPLAVELVIHREVAAVVSLVPRRAGGDTEESTRQKVRAMRRDMLAHTDVLNRLLESTTLLPVRFGVVLPDEQAVVDTLLEPQHDVLVAHLERLEGAVEISLKANYKEELVLREVVREQPHLSRQSARAGGGTSALADRIDLGKQVAAAVEAKRDRDGRWLLEQLSPLARDVTVAEPASELMVLNASFLVDREALDQFDRRLNKTSRDTTPRMRLTCVGPLPPYSFVDLRLEAPGH